MPHRENVEQQVDLTTSPVLLSHRENDNDQMNNENGKFIVLTEIFC